MPGLTSPSSRPERTGYLSLYQNKRPCARSWRAGERQGLTIPAWLEGDGFLDNDRHLTTVPLKLEWNHSLASAKHLKTPIYSAQHSKARPERRTTRGGRDSIDHLPGAHDDLANAVAGALVTAFTDPGYSSAKRERDNLKINGWSSQMRRAVVWLLRPHPSGSVIKSRESLNGVTKAGSWRWDFVIGADQSPRLPQAPTA